MVTVPETRPPISEGGVTRSGRARYRISCLKPGWKATERGRTSNHRAGGDPFAELKDAHGYYEVSEAYRENAGRVGDLFVDAKDRPIYVGLRTRLLGMRSTLVPVYR